MAIEIPQPNFPKEPKSEDLSEETQAIERIIAVLEKDYDNREEIIEEVEAMTGKSIWDVARDPWEVETIIYSFAQARKEEEERKKWH